MNKEIHMIFLLNSYELLTQKKIENNVYSLPTFLSYLSRKQLQLFQTEENHRLIYENKGSASSESR
jgi:hypothetical protein